MEDELNVCTSVCASRYLGLAGCGGGSKAADVAVLMRERPMTQSALMYEPRRPQVGEAWDMDWANTGYAACAC